MYKDVVERLYSLGYIVKSDDKWVLDFLIGKVANEVKNECNIAAIPAGLYQIAVDMVCGEFLSAKKGSGQLNDFDVEEVIKSIKEGDTTTTYAVSDGAVTLDGLISHLMNCGNSQFAKYRRIVW